MVTPDRDGYSISPPTTVISSPMNQRAAEVPIKLDGFCEL